MARPEILGAMPFVLKALPLKAKAVGAAGAASATALGGTGLNKDRIAGQVE